ncbi:hypothetical protein E3E35_08285 [Thermococcus sp. GR7]|nr:MULTISPECIES: DUF4350 domain-containing protein [unclassified Thermococcus]NJE47395.1 hypothetical protein [Thermococcus sp. GR7]NJE78890.1 hypothetical protein [Thermococcus sp. GR4]NJF23115.1 hypothetical protein [Thermococcus sp. GR5]
MKRWSLVLMALLILSLVPAWAIKPVQAATYVPIQEIQSNTTDGDASAYVGQIVTTRGVVTAVTSKGFFIQNGTGPWSGIYVYLGTSPGVNIGDYIEVTGEVLEWYGLTQISNSPTVTVLGTAPIPDPVILPTGDVAQEQWESVLVKVENVVVTNPDLGYGEWEIDDGSGPVRVDDLIYAYTPLDGQELDYVIGVVYYSYGNFKIEPRNADDIGIPPEIPVVSVQEIQGGTSTSPYVDQVVKTYGVVTFVTSYGFAIQNGTGPWSGIWVYTGSTPPVNVGEYVSVQALVKEFYYFTEIDYKDTPIDQRSIEVLGTAEVPEPVVLPTGNVSQEQWEGVLVEVRDVKVVDPDLGYGEWSVDDGSGPVRIDDKFYDYTPSHVRYEYIRGIVWYSYGNFKIEPRSASDIKPYVPQIGVETFEVSGPMIKRVPRNISVRVYNHGTLDDNVTVVLLANGDEIGRDSQVIGINQTAVYEFTYMPGFTGDLTITVIVIDGTGEIADERYYSYFVVPNPYTISYGLTPYYERLYIKEENNLAELYENFTYTVNKLKQYGVDFGDLEPKIQWINETMKEIQREYSIYNSLKGLLVQQNPYRASYYYPVMVHIRKAALMSKEVMQEIEFVLPHLQDVLEEVEATYQPPTPTPGNETNMTQPGNITITITKVLIDASHGQYYVEEVGVNGLAEKIKSDLGWEVEINKLPLTYDLLKEYDVVIILNPKEDLTPNEVAALQEYVENGGGLFIAGDWYKYSNVESLNAVVEKYGIKFNADELMDDDVNSGRPYYPFVGIYNTAHPAMKFVPEDWKTYYNGQTLTISGEVTWLIKAYDTSYSVDANGNVVRGKGTNPIVAAAVEAGNGRIVAYGSSKAISDSYYGKYIDSNWPFVKGVLLWLAHEI